MEKRDDSESVERSDNFNCTVGGKQGVNSILISEGGGKFNLSMMVILKSWSQ